VEHGNVNREWTQMDTNGSRRGLHTMRNGRIKIGSDWRNDLVRAGMLGYISRPLTEAQEG
jgi:hypothetical protein